MWLETLFFFLFFVKVNKLYLLEFGITKIFNHKKKLSGMISVRIYDVWQGIRVLKFSITKKKKLSGVISVRIYDARKGIQVLVRYGDTTF